MIFGACDNLLLNSEYMPKVLGSSSSSIKISKTIIIIFLIRDKRNGGGGGAGTSKRLRWKRPKDFNVIKTYCYGKNCS